MLVREILGAKGYHVVSIRPEAPIAEVAGLLKQHGVGAALVVDGAGGLLGVISERDLVSGIAIRGATLLEARAAQWMTKAPVTCTPDDDVDILTHTMTVIRFRHVPVIQGGEVVGVISIGDVVKHRLQHLETEAHRLQDYIARSGTDEPSD